MGRGRRDVDFRQVTSAQIRLDSLRKCPVQLSAHLGQIGLIERRNVLAQGELKMAAMLAAGVEMQL